MSDTKWSERREEKQRQSKRHSLVFNVVIAVVGMVIGLFFIVSQGDNKPIPREEAVAYSGEFESYESSENYCGICFADGSYYAVYAHTETEEFRETMKSLTVGTPLSILVNPYNEYVIEIKTATQELLNFEASQEAIDSYDNSYIILGIVVIVCGIGLLVMAAVDVFRKRSGGNADNSAASSKQKESLAIRYADFGVKSRILLEAEAETYTICYRRVKTVNELVVNGRVYDEKKGLIEFEHTLRAVIDGHTIEAGLDELSWSYIRFDGELIAYKERII